MSVLSVSTGNQLFKVSKTGFFTSSQVLSKTKVCHVVCIDNCMLFCIIDYIIYATVTGFQYEINSRLIKVH